LAKQKVIAVIDHDLGIIESLELMLLSCAIPPGCLRRRTTSSTRRQPFKRRNVSGMELVRALCAQGFTLPVIFITGSHDELHQRRAMKLDCAAFIAQAIF
jgi:FixJ family two-component response regulator